MIEIPYFQETHEIRTRVGEFRMLFIRRLLFIGGPFAGILNFQPRCQDEHVSETTQVFGRQNHAADSRIHRKSTELFAKRCQAMMCVNRSKFK